MEAIFASSENRAFGLKGSMPWDSITEDFKHFKEVTMGKVLAVGKTTLSTLPPLKGRELLLIERGDTLPADCIIIGGLSLLTVPNLARCDVIWYTRIKGITAHADTVVSRGVTNFIETLIPTGEIILETDKCIIYKLKGNQ